MKNLSQKNAKVLAATAHKMAKASASSRCMFCFHQPKMPDSVKALKKN